MSSSIGQPIHRVACVQLDARLPDFCSRVVMPRYGLPVIGTILKQQGYEVQVYVEHVAPPDLDYLLSADAVLFSGLTGAATRTYELAAEVRRRSRAPLIMGGEHATSFADDALNSMDYVVRREGDHIIVDLLRALESGQPVDEIPGISFWRGGAKRHNPPGSPPEDIETSYDLDIIHGYPRQSGLALALGRRQAKIICIQSTRGCPYQCSFCVTPRLFGYSYRFRDIDAVVEDIQGKLPYGREFLFVDNLFGIHRKRTLELLRRMIALGIGRRAEFTCFCRVEIGQDQELLAAMREAGIRTICLGLESLSDQTLQGIRKQQKLTDIVEAILAIRRSDIKVSGSFIAGSDGDTRASLLETVDFCIEQGLHSFFYIALWYYPGDPQSPLDLHRQIIPSFDYCTGSFVTHFPARMKPSTLQRTIVEAQRKFWGLERAARLMAKGDLAQAAHIAAHRYAFAPVERHQLDYADRLEEVERGYYDAAENLLMDRIATRSPDPIVEQAAAAGVVQLDSKRARLASDERLHG